MPATATQIVSQPSAVFVIDQPSTVPQKLSDLKLLCILLHGKGFWIPASTPKDNKKHP